MGIRQTYLDLGMSIDVTNEQKDTSGQSRFLKGKPDIKKESLMKILYVMVMYYPENSLHEMSLECI